MIKGLRKALQIKMKTVL